MEGRSGAEQKQVWLPCTGKTSTLDWLCLCGTQTASHHNCKPRVCLHARPPPPLTPAPRSTTRLASMVSWRVMRYWPGGTDTVTPLLLVVARAEALAMAAKNAVVSSARQNLLAVGGDWRR